MGPGSDRGPSDRCGAGTIHHQFRIAQIVIFGEVLIGPDAREQAAPPRPRQRRHARDAIAQNIAFHRERAVLDEAVERMRNRGSRNRVAATAVDANEQDAFANIAFGSVVRMETWNCGHEGQHGEGHGNSIVHEALNVKKRRD